MLDIVKVLFGGFGENLRIFVLTLAMAIPLGLVITFGSMTKFRPIRWLTRTFVWVIRGTPLMLQLFVVLYAPGLLFGMPMRNRMVATLVAFVINYAAYFSEIYRGGIESIPLGQYEAGAVLGMTRAQIFFRVVLLQVVKRITPSMGNEVITLVKDTALSRVIGVAEIIMVAERYTKQGLIGPLFSTGLYFLIFNGLLTLLLGWIERRMDYFRC
ncbi:MAG: amino acid ABC transporter permease [Clostridia bacterium]|nr:amino acid ABC transporter permease [Clostridia bacterium]